MRRFALTLLAVVAVTLSSACEDVKDSEPTPTGAATTPRPTQSSEKPLSQQEKDAVAVLEASDVHLNENPRTTYRNLVKICKKLTAPGSSSEQRRMGRADQEKLTAELYPQLDEPRRNRIIGAANGTCDTRVH